MRYPPRTPSAPAQIQLLGRESRGHQAHALVWRPAFESQGWAVYFRSKHIPLILRTETVPPLRAGPPTRSAPSRPTLDRLASRCGAAATAGGNLPYRPTDAPRLAGTRVSCSISLPFDSLTNDPNPQVRRISSIAEASVR